MSAYSTLSRYDAAPRAPKMHVWRHNGWWVFGDPAEPQPRGCATSIHELHHVATMTAWCRACLEKNSWHGTEAFVARHGDLSDERLEKPS